MTSPSSDYTIRQLARDVLELVEKVGWDGPRLLEGLHGPYSRILVTDLNNIGVKRQGNHIDYSKYLYYDGEMSITFDQLPLGKAIPPHDHGVWEAMGIYSGRLKHVVYDRVDNRRIEGYAELRVLDDRVLAPNDIAIVAPPAEIHSFEALTRRHLLCHHRGRPLQGRAVLLQPDREQPRAHESEVAESDLGPGPASGFRDPPRPDAA